MFKCVVAFFVWLLSSNNDNMEDICRRCDERLKEISIRYHELNKNATSVDELNLNDDNFDIELDESWDKFNSEYECFENNIMLKAFMRYFLLILLVLLFGFVFKF